MSYQQPPQQPYQQPPQQPYQQPPQQPYQQPPYQQPPQQPYQQPPYQQPPYQQAYPPQMVKLRTDFSMGKTVLLSLITFGIYGIIVWMRLVDNINTLATPYDRKNTMNYLLMYLLSIITLGIYPFIWNHQLCDRIGQELYRRRINYELNSSTFWLWGVLGSFIIVGPFIYMDKVFNATNMLSQHYNQFG